jgi:hypothetical protein
MNTISGGKLYSYEKEQHDQRVARRAAQKKHEDDVSKIVVDDVNENEIISTPTASPERQREIHRQMVEYATMQYNRTKAVNQFKQQNSDPAQDATTDAGSIGGRMMQGFYQDEESAEYPDNARMHNLNALQAIRSTMGGQRKVERIDEIKPTAGQDDPPELGRAKQIRAVVVPILSELRDIESGEGFQSVAAASYGRAKQLVGEINSMQDLLKYFCANDTVKDYMYRFCYSSKEEYKRLTMGMSMALSRTGKSLGNELGMDNISGFQNRVGIRVKDELDAGR